MKLESFSAFPKEGLRFLRSLKRNNNREWFLEHKSIYEAAVRKPMESLVERLAEDFAQFAPEMVASPKVSIYRIYRDTRFSNDKAPYKTNTAAVFPRKGLDKHEGAGFYIHLATDELLIGGGLYMSLPEDLNEVRSRIARNHAEFRQILANPRFKKLFGGLEGIQLSRVPRGFAPDHPAADLLRYKQYLAGRTLDPEKALQSDFYETVKKTYQEMVPFIRFLNEPILRARRARDRQQALLS